MRARPTLSPSTLPLLLAFAASPALVPLAACTPKNDMPLVGVSNVSSHDLQSAAPSASASPTPSPLATNFRATFVKVNRQRFASRGHSNERFDVDIFVNPEGQEAYNASTGDVPVGTTLVKEQFERNASGSATGERPASIMVMTKREAGYDPAHGDWRWTALNSRGEVVADGKLDRCTQCHKDAPHDYIFRVDD
jgi:hypothetical protein